MIMTNRTAKIIWFTGLSGAGKTTLSNILYKKLNYKYKVKKIDGDIFRKKNNIKKVFSKKNIIFNNLKIIDLIEKNLNKYDFILVSVISPLKKTRLLAKKKFNKFYYEVFVKCNFQTLNERDTKGLYHKANLGNLKLIGYNSKIKYEQSNYKILTIKTDSFSLKECLKKIINKLKIRV